MKLWAPDAILLSSMICKRQVKLGSLKVWSKNEMKEYAQNLLITTADTVSGSFSLSHLIKNKRKKDLGKKLSLKYHLQ